MSFTLVSSQAIVRKAGLNANATIIASGAALSDWADQAEGKLCAVTRYDWVSNYASVGTNFKPILAAYCSADAANHLISYAISAYTSRGEAQTMLDVNENEKRECVEQLKLIEVQETMI